MLGKKSKDDKKAATLAQLDADDIRLALQDWDATCIDTVIPDQLAMYSSHFAQWEHQLIAGFNLLFTGLGSKLQLLQSFACHLNHMHVLQIHGCSTKNLPQTDPLKNKFVTLWSSIIDMLLI
ncbi:hypothetical protein DYB28_006041 [Aphanomyces astaci]|uniref:Origin recognition complex subunit 2 n=1 Tax=Aphanomyces astaci TaxID=112090 RepID=A0A9X8H7Z8_APHAT|nr:hypothetical protein DYB28_006041 [Aphanomyces astaci]